MDGILGFCGEQGDVPNMTQMKFCNIELTFGHLWPSSVQKE